MVRRIIEKTETVSGTPSNYEYTYDAMGRLLTVTKDSNLVEEYQYDIVGTRTYEVNTLRGISGRGLAYSNEDHLLTAGGAIYEYDEDGFLISKTHGTDVTSYDYSSRGELLGATLPDLRMIDYVYDPLGRRIAKKINGSVVEEYLWQGLTRLLAVYDGSDNLIMRFEYADGRVPIAMTRDGSTYYLTYDQVGSLRVISDSSIRHWMFPSALPEVSTTEIPILSVSATVTMTPTSAAGPQKIPYSLREGIQISTVTALMIR
jgi:YD repeat-containing protein